MRNSTDKQWTGKSRGGSFGYSFFIMLIKVFGIRMAYIFLTLIVIYFIPFAPKATKAIWHYNRKIQGYSIFKSLYKLYIHYYTFGQSIIDKTAINYGFAQKYEFLFDNYQAALEILNNGSTALIGAHIGSWEIGAEFFNESENKINIVMYDAEYRKIKSLVDSPDLKYKVIPINEGSIESLIRIKAAVDNSEHICFQGDRFINKSTSTAVSFLGRTAHFPNGPTLIASKLKLPTIFYFSMREKGMKYRFIFRIAPAGLKADELLKIYTKELEEVVKKYPQQWFNFYKLWD